MKKILLLLIACSSISLMGGPEDNDLVEAQIAPYQAPPPYNPSAPLPDDYDPNNNNSYRVPAKLPNKHAQNDESDHLMNDESSPMNCCKVTANTLDSGCNALCTTAAAFVACAIDLACLPPVILCRPCKNANDPSRNDGLFHCLRNVICVEALEKTTCCDVDITTSEKSSCTYYCCCGYCC